MSNEVNVSISNLVLIYFFYDLRSKHVFSQEMSTRLGGYDHFSSQARLRQLLSANGGIQGRADIIGGRLAELKGLPPPEVVFKRSASSSIPHGS